jgi:hypothetical protein
MACLEIIIDQPSCDFPRIRVPLISKIVSKQLHVCMYVYMYTYGMLDPTKTEAKPKQLIESTGRYNGYSV